MISKGLARRTKRQKMKGGRGVKKKKEMGAGISKSKKFRTRAVWHAEKRRPRSKVLIVASALPLHPHMLTDLIHESSRLSERILNWSFPVF